MTNHAAAMHMTQQLSGHISLAVLNATGKVVKEVPEFRNLIVDAGLNYLMSTVSGNIENMALSVKVGTGSGTPAAGDTVLPGFLVGVGRVAASSVGAFQTTTAPYYYEATYTYLFPLGAIAATLTCIGAHNSATGSSVYAWSQIKDGSNNPTTLTILADEQLSVTYKFRLYAPVFTTTGSISVTGDGSHNFTMYAHGFGSGNWGDGGGSCIPTPTNMSVRSWTTFTPPADIKSNPVYTGLSNAALAVTRSTYVAGTFTRTMTGFMSTSVNVSGSTIEGIMLNTGTNGPVYSIALDTPIPKDGTQTLSLTYSYSLARYP